MKETLPQSVKDELAEIEKNDKIEENDLEVPNDKTIQGLAKIIGEVDAQLFSQFTKDLQSETVAKFFCGQLCSFEPVWHGHQP